MLALSGLLVSAPCLEAQYYPYHVEEHTETKELAIPPVAEAQELPIRDVTIFKDGHALILRQGLVNLGDNGEAVLRASPQPVLGTFWSWVSGKGNHLKGVRARRVEVNALREAESLAELLKANTGRMVELSLSEDETPLSGVLKSVNGPMVMLTEKSGSTRLVLSELIQQVRFPESEEVSLKVDGAPSEAYHLQLDVDSKADTVEAGVGYVQKGIRWIPGYRIELGENNKARVELQGTVVNDVDDFSNSTIRFVVGVPSLLFQGQWDSFALDQVREEVQSYYTNRRGNIDILSNRIMSQSVGIYSQGMDSGEEEEVGEMPAGEDLEDLYFYTLENISMVKGERLIVPIGSFDTTYEDVFTVDLGTALPQSVRASYNMPDNVTRELEESYNNPKVIRKIRMKNEGQAPLTTGPAMVFNNDRFMAQGLVFYTPSGATCDVSLNPAIDISVKVNESEIRRTHGHTINESSYSKSFMTAQVNLTNRRGSPVEVEVTRYVFGEVSEASDAAQSSVSPDFILEGALRYSPWWYRNLNPATKLTWVIKLEPGETKSLNYAWNFYLR
ncbi:MAG: hypothetical protein SFY68_02575 [Candidatus Sumerlaeia bacterium]|nr:hypothetical protein [Candidatus Sumerlaeia bacterium]